MFLSQGDLFAPDLETPNVITMKGYQDALQLETLVADWPTTLRIVGFIPQNFLTLRYTGKSNWLVFRARESDEVLTHMQKNNLCATIPIRPMALLLSVRDEVCDLIGVLVHEDILSLWSETSRQLQEQLRLDNPPPWPLQQWRWQQLQQQVRWQQLLQQVKQLHQEVQLLLRQVQKGQYRLSKGKLKSPQRQLYEQQLLELPRDLQEESPDRLRRLSKEVLEDHLVELLQNEMELLLQARLDLLERLQLRLDYCQQYVMYELPDFIGSHCVEG
ncbi:Mediator of RNA polymerase II transcription subunit 25-like protein [Drosera capensis]